MAGKRIAKPFTENVEYFESSNHVLNQDALGTMLLILGTTEALLLGPSLQSGRRSCNTRSKSSGKIPVRRPKVSGLWRKLGKDIYDVYRGRLRKAVNHPEFHDDYFWAFVQNHHTSPEEKLPAPSDLSAHTPAPATVRLEWTDPATNEVGFKIERSRSPNSGFQPIATGTQYVPRYVGSCPSSGDTYYYRVRAYNYASGMSAPSNAVAACNRSPKK